METFTRLRSSWLKNGRVWGIRLSPISLLEGIARTFPTRTLSNVWESKVPPLVQDLRQVHPQHQLHGHTHRRRLGQVLLQVHLLLGLQQHARSASWTDVHTSTRRRALRARLASRSTKARVRVLVFPTHSKKSPLGSATHLSPFLYKYHVPFTL